MGWLAQRYQTIYLLVHLKKKKRHKNQPQPGLHLMKSLAVAGQIYTLSSGGFTMKIDLRLLFLVLLTTSQLKELTLTVLTWRSPTVICDYVGEAPPQGKENGGTARLAERVRWLTVLPRCL